MILLCRLVLLGWLGAAGLLPSASGQSSAADTARASRLAERYEAMLAANPVEGIALDRLWQAAEERGATAALLESYRKAAEITTPTAKGFAAALVYGHLLKKAGRADEAAQAYREAAALVPDSPLPPLAQAELARAQTRPADAAEFYAQAVALLPKGDRRENELLLKLGESQLAAGQATAAAQSWERILALDPNNNALRRQLADSFEKNRLPDRAAEQYEAIAAKGEPPERALALRELARLRQASGQFDAARDALERGLALTARDNWLHGDLQTSLIRLYQRADRAGDLAARWQAAVEQTPRDLGAYLRLEALAEAQADPAAQRQWLEKITALAPGDRDAARKLARLLADAGERDRAAALYDGLLKARPDDLELCFARAEIDIQQDHPDAAVARVEARLAQSPGDDTVGAAALEFFLHRRLFPAAERRLRAETARQPDAEEPALALARFLFGQRRPAEGRAALEAMIARAPASADPAARAVRLARAADTFREGKLPDDALRCWQEAAALRPADPAPLLAAADLLQARGDSAGAADLASRAVDALPVTSPGREDAEKKLLQFLQAADDAATGPAAFGGVSPPPPPGIIIPSLARRRRGGGAGMPPVTIALDDPEAAANAAKRLLPKYLARISADARDHPTAENFLRLARWLDWTHIPQDATDAARRALEIDPKSIPARDLLVTLANEAGDHDEAIRRLREIAALDPSRRAASARAIASLQLDDGDANSALSALEELERVAPGSPSALSDLAAAYQRADRWADALAAWERAYALPALTPQQRSDLRRPLLAALEHLEKFSRAFDLLLAAVDEPSDLTARQDRFHELTDFCRRHGLIGQLATRIDERLKAQPQDYFLLTAAADLRRVLGREREAYDFLHLAYFSAPDPARCLRALVDQAQALGDVDAAIADQRRLVGLPGQNSAEALQKLAALQAANLDADGAARTWESLIARFPRDADTLARAEEFFEKAGRADRARTLLGQLAALDPSDLKRLLRLGQLDAAAGDLAGAQKAFESVLSRTAPEAAGDPLQIPPTASPNGGPEEGRPGGPSPGRPFLGGGFRVPRFASGTAGGGSRRPTYSASGPGFTLPDFVPGAALADDDERRLRLEAIRGISLLLFAPTSGKEPEADAFYVAQFWQRLSPSPPSKEALAKQRAWYDSWQAAAKKGARNEPLWAFFYAGYSTAAMDHLADWMDAQPDGGVQDAFLNVGLRLGQWRRVAQWAWSGADTGRGDLLLSALAEFLGQNREVPPILLDDLFPPEVKARDTLWKAASTLFAPRQRFAEAAALGSRALDLARDNRASYALEIAKWRLALGQPDAARAVLRASIEGSAADSFDAPDPLFTALRAYWLLLPARERPAFADEYLRRAAVPAARARSGPAQPLLAGALLHGLAGDEAAAGSELDALVDLRMLASEAAAGPADARRWNYLLLNGEALVNWNLPGLAARLWRRALREPDAFARQNEECLGIIEEMRARLMGAEVAAAPNPQQARERIADYLRTDPPAPPVAVVAGELLAAGRTASAARLYAHLCTTEMAGNVNAGYTRALLGAYEAAGDRDSLEIALRSLLDRTRARDPGAAAAPPPGAFINPTELATRLASVLEANGDIAGARRVLTRARAGNAPNAFPLGYQLARLCERAKLSDEAAAVWRELAPRDPSGGALLALANLEEGRGQPQKAIDLLKPRAEDRSAKSGGNRGEMTVKLAGLYLAAGQPEAARALGDRLLREGNLDASIPGIAAALAKAGQRPAARELLAAIVRRARDAQTRFAWQQALVECCAAPDDDPALLKRELRHLSVMAGDDPGLHASFMNVRFVQAREQGVNNNVWLRGRLDGWLEGEMRREWDAGRGDPLAGAKLVELFLQIRQDDSLREIAEAIASRPALPETMLFGLQESLQRAGHADLAAPLTARLHKRFPQNDLYTVAHARALWKTGCRPEAVALLDAMDAAALLREDSTVQAATLWLELGERERAKESLRRFVAADPQAVRSPLPHLRLARLALEDKNLPAARDWLRAAYRNPSCADLDPLLDYLAAAGQLDQAQPAPGADFPLSRLRRGQLLAGMCERLTKMGRPETAQRLALANAELLAGAPALAAKLRADPPAAGLPELAGALETALEQSNPPPPRLARELAALEIRLADDALAAGGAERRAEAVERLTRARQLQPEDFTSARKLAALYLEKKQTARAAETLQAFLGEDALPGERDEARRLLGKK